jgi:hypothetical protein
MRDVSIAMEILAIAGCNMTIGMTYTGTWGRESAPFRPFHVKILKVVDI